LLKPYKKAGKRGKRLSIKVRNFSKTRLERTDKGNQAAADFVQGLGTAPSKRWPFTALGIPDPVIKSV
jgi:hypothetical protein